MKRILCIWLPNWPVQRLVVARPELKRRAIVLYAHRSRHGHRIVACSPAAARRGIRLDMPPAEAKSLSERADDPGRWGDLHLEPHDRQADRAALEQLALWCERFSPLVGLEVADRPESLLLDVTCLGPLFGGEEMLAHKVARGLHRRGYTGRLAVADTIGAAWAVAHFAEPAGPPDRLPVAPPVVVPQGSSAEVDALPVEALRLSQQTAGLLGRLGIDRIGQLRRLPRGSLVSRFGGELVERLDQAAGDVQEMLIAHRPPPELEAAWSLEHPTDRRQTIDQIIAQLVQRVAVQLAERQQGAVQLECRLDCTGAGPVSLRVGLFRPTAEPRHLLELVRMQLELLTVPAAVEEVRVRATVSAPLEQRQGGLFADKIHRRSRQLAVFVDRLSSRLGRPCVTRPQLQAGAQPERAYRCAALTGKRPISPKTSSPKTGSPKTAQKVVGPLQRPLRLHRPPIPIDVICVAPDGPPALLHDRSQRHPIARRWGPERIETGWWRGRSVRRDYYRVETGGGNRFWIFRRLQDGKWFLHGEFE